MTAYYKDNGTWSKLAPFGKLNGTWSQAKEAFVKSEGTWKQYWLQSSANDSTFNIEDTIPQTFTGTVNKIVIQQDEKILVGGSFKQCLGQSRAGITRLNSDGTLDTSFNIGTGAGLNPVYAIEIQPDGKILVGGSFSSFNGTGQSYLIRLNADGSRDSSFSTNFNNFIRDIKIQSDGKIIVAGGFTSYGPTTTNYIARLNLDGTLDSSFNTGTGFNNSIMKIAIQSDNKIVVAGNFTAYNGTSSLSYLARLNSDGSIDTSLNTGTGFNGSLNSVAIQSNGKIIVSGAFSNYNGSSANRIVKLNSDGTRNSTEQFVNVSANNVNDIIIKSDGKVLFPGYYNDILGKLRGGVLFFNTDGTLDTSIDIKTKFDDTVYTVAVKSDGSLFVGGNFSSFNDVLQTRITHLSSSGSILSTFASNYGASASVRSIAIQSDNKILLGGYFKFFNSFIKNNLVRINQDGSVDTSFSSYFSNDTFINVNKVIVQPDNKILVGGQFSSYGGVARKYILRLNSNGTLDTSFNAGDSVTNNWILPMVLQSDGKILIGGAFYGFNGTSQDRIARLNADGTPDSSFNAGTGFDGVTYDIALQSDGKILVCGNFTTYNGTSANRIIRLNSDASVDSSFNVGTGFDNYPQQIIVQPDGKIIIGGIFTSYNGVSRQGIIRINQDGSIDNSFNSGSGFNYLGYINASALQSDEKILLGGSFTSYNGSSRESLIRLNKNGSIDTSFNNTNNLPPYSYIYTISTLPNNKIMIGGSFVSYANKVRNSIAVVGSEVYVQPPAFISLPTNSSVGSSSATISWSSTNQTSYAITLSPSVSGQPFTGTTATSRTITGLSGSTSYTATVELFNDSIESSLESTSFTTIASPQPNFTSSPTASSIGPSSATISWGSTEQLSYSITLSPSVSGQPFTGTTATSRTITGLSESTSYTATIQILNGPNSASQNVSFSTIAAPTTVSSISYVPVTTDPTNISTKTFGGTDDGYYTITLPFSTFYAGTSYNQIHVGTNSYVTFGGGATNYSGLGPSVPAFPKIMINAADRGSTSIYYTSDASSWTMRYEGSTGTSGTPTTIIWELYCSSSDPKTMRLSIAQTPGGGTTGLYDSATLIASLAGGANTSWNIVSI